MVSEWITLEFSVCRIGGPDGYERDFGPWRVSLHTAPGSVDFLQLQGRQLPSQFVRLDLRDWTAAHPGWMGVKMQLADMNGRPIGDRPALVYTHPCDTPTHVGFLDVDTDALYSVAVRMP